MVLAVYVTPLLIWQWRRGVFTPHAFDAAPPRSGTLVPADLLVGVGLWFVGSGVGAYLASTVVGMGDAPGAMLVRGLAAQAGMLPAVVYTIVRARLGVEGGVRAWGFASPVAPALGQTLAVTLFLVPATLLTLSLAAYISKQFGHVPDPIGHQLLRAMHESPDPGIILAFAVSAVVLAPIIEEIIFRGLLQTGLRHCTGVNHRWLVIAIASVLFTAIHLGVEPIAIPGLFVLSLGLGYVYERTGSIWTSMLVHAAFNALNIAAVFAGWVEA